MCNINYNKIKKNDMKSYTRLYINQSYIPYVTTRHKSKSSR